MMEVKRWGYVPTEGYYCVGDVLPFTLNDGEQLGEDEMDTVADSKVNGQYLLQTLGGIVGLGDVIAAGVLGLATTATRHSGD